MKLICVSAYASSHGSFAEGQEVNVNDDEGAFLLRDSPGSFRPYGEAPEEAPAEPEMAAMSTETESGLVVPDRRMKGGKKRAAPPKKKPGSRRSGK